MDSLTALVAALAEVAALRDKLTVRGVHVHCMWCRAVVGEVHHNGSPDAQKDALDVAQRLAEEHDPTCPKNPYTAEIVRLRAQAAALTPDPEVLAVAGEVLRLAERREVLAARVNNGEIEAMDTLLSVEEKWRTLAPQIAAWFVNRGGK